MLLRWTGKGIPCTCNRCGSKIALVCFLCYTQDCDVQQKKRLKSAKQTVRVCMCVVRSTLYNQLAVYFPLKLNRYPIPKYEVPTKDLGLTSDLRTVHIAIIR
jgi:hypothetical protein